VSTKDRRTVGLVEITITLDWQELVLAICLLLAYRERNVRRLS
jgi:hypothetical protein